MINDYNIRSCPYCGSDNIYFYVSRGYDLYSNYVTNYFIECRDCGTNIKSRDIKKMIYKWNNG